MKWKKCNQCGEPMLSDFEDCTACWVTDAYFKSKAKEKRDEEK